MTDSEQNSESVRARNAAARVRRLDKLIAQPDYEELNKNVEDGVTEWEERFIANLKDQVDREKRQLTLKQIAIVEDIYERAYISDLIEDETEWQGYLV